MIVMGWDAIRTVLEKTGKTVVAVDLYVGTYEDEIVRDLSKGFDTVIDTRTLMKSEEERVRGKTLCITHRFSVV